MKFNNEKINLKKSVLVAAIASALLLTGCAGEDGNTGAQGTPGMQGPVGPTGPTGENGPTGPAGENGSGAGAGEGSGAAAFAYTTSDYAIYEDSIFVADYFDGELKGNGSEDITDAILFAVSDLEDNDVLVLPKGTFNVLKTIKFSNKSNITVTGYGIYETKLNFGNAVVDKELDENSGDAFSFSTTHDVEIRDFSVYEANSNGIKVTGSNGVYMAYTAAIWDGVLDSQNGAYGLYPVKSQNVLMEYNYSYGSADAGIYVGQSANIVVRHNVAKNNVAGIEIENSDNADVYKNLAIENSGGILVFDLPGLPKAYGGKVRVFDNEMLSNNTENVAAKGTVGYVPPGTGFLNLAMSDVELYHNLFRENNTSAMEFATYFLIDDDFSKYASDQVPGNYVSTMINGWSPNYRNNYVHDNVIERSGAAPDGFLLDENLVKLSSEEEELIKQGFGLDELPATSIRNGFMGQTIQFAADPSTGAATPVGISDKSSNTIMPAILFDGIGQFIFTQTDTFSASDLMIFQPEIFAQYGKNDGLCLNNNIDGNSAASSDEFGPAMIGTVFPTDFAAATSGFSGGLPAPIFLLEEIHGDNHSYSCDLEELVRLPPATVVFRGKEYGCAGDDQASFSCNL